MLEQRFYKTYKQIGQNIRRFRKLQGLTQEALAEKAGINRGYLSHLEMGMPNSSMSLNMLFVLSETLGIQPYKLLQFDDLDRESLS